MCEIGLATPEFGLFRLARPVAMNSFLSLVNVCDNYRLDHSVEPLLPFYVKSSTGKEIAIGWIRPKLIPVLESTAQSVFDLSSSGLRFLPGYDTTEKRSLAIGNICQKWRADGLFSNVIGGHLWRNELYAIYYDPFRLQDIAFTLERSCCGLFGVVTYVRLCSNWYSDRSCNVIFKGVHMTMMLEDGEKIWVPKRASTKQTFVNF